MQAGWRGASADGLCVSSALLLLLLLQAGLRPSHIRTQSAAEGPAASTVATSADGPSLRVATHTRSASALPATSSSEQHAAAGAAAAGEGSASKQDAPAAVDKVSLAKGAIEARWKRPSGRRRPGAREGRGGGGQQEGREGRELAAKSGGLGGGQSR